MASVFGWGFPLDMVEAEILLLSLVMCLAMKLQASLLVWCSEFWFWWVAALNQLCSCSTCFTVVSLVFSHLPLPSPLIPVCCQAWASYPSAYYPWASYPWASYPWTSTVGTGKEHFWVSEKYLFATQSQEQPFSFFLTGAQNMQRQVTELETLWKILLESNLRGNFSITSSSRQHQP